MRLQELIDLWEHRARFAFKNAEQEKDDALKRPTGKQFIEHGAMIYFNCAKELRETLTLLLPPPSDSPPRD